VTARRRAVLAALLAGAAAITCADPAAAKRSVAAAPAPLTREVAVRASVTPKRVRLGDRVTYAGQVIVPPGVAVQWLPPAGGGSWTWSALRAWRSPGTRGERGARGRGPSDTVHVEAALQAFVVGALAIPGVGFRLTDTPGTPSHVGRLPVVRIVVLSAIASADTAPDLRPVRGPLAAPWWERVPWRWVALGALALGALGMAWVVLARRRRKAGDPGSPLAAAAGDPAARALAELESLRGLTLPEQGRFGEHAFHLTRIARRFVEAVAGTPRPGDTTPEIVEHLRASALAEGDVTALADLFRSWDLVKFARGSTTVDEARRAERALEALVLRWRDARQSAAGKVA
jgi:hypothetical protein